MRLNATLHIVCPPLLLYRFWWQQFAASPIAHSTIFVTVTGIAQYYTRRRGVVAATSLEPRARQYLLGEEMIVDDVSLFYVTTTLTNVLS